MTEIDLENKIIEVIDILKNEIDTKKTGVGVYKDLLKVYTNSLEECHKGNYEMARIKGTIRYLYDSLAPKNVELETKMDEAISALELFRGK